MLHKPTSEKPTGLVTLKEWYERMQLSRQQAWVFRKNGWLKVVHIGRKPYVTAEAAAEFDKRAAKGEFAGEKKEKL